jgi:hypothetical protein
MRNHQHYYNWTIEWEENSIGVRDFRLCRTVINPGKGGEFMECTPIRVNGTLDVCIGGCKNIIDDIIAQQNDVAKKVLNIA